MPYYKKSRKPILRCPVCKHTARVKWHAKMGAHWTQDECWAWVECPYCGTQGPQGDGTSGDVSAIDKWNRRKDIAPNYYAQRKEAQIKRLKATIRELRKAKK